MLNRINITVFIVAVLGTALSFSIYFWQNQTQHELLQEKFKAQIERKTYEIKEGLEHNMHVLKSLAVYYYGSNSINRDEFKRYTSVMMKMDPTIYALEWVAKVPHKLKEKFEKGAQSKGFENFFIYELDSEGKKKRVSYRQNYYPVFYIEPLRNNEIEFGFDHGSEKNRNEALFDSVKTSSVSMTAPIDLVQNEKGVLLFYPVYKERKTKQEVVGFFTAVVKAEKLISESIKDTFFDKGVASITVKSKEGELLFSHKNPGSTTDLYQESKIDFASKSWKVEAYASEYFIQAQSSNYPLTLLILLLSITFLIAFDIYLILKKQEILLESNDEMRRFQNVAVTREERIAELKRVIKELQEQNGKKNV